MIEVTEKNHAAIIIGSLDKIYNNSKITGVFKSDDIYILDSVYKLLSGCTTSISNVQKKTLISLYNSILNQSDYTCKSIFLKDNSYILKSSFIQSDQSGIIANSTVKKIYYWQEANTSVLQADIINNVNTVGYLQNKLFSTVGIFSVGKTIPYNSIGLISFAIVNSLATDNYKIYDILNNNVTDSFTKIYLSNKVLLFISKNIYSYGNLFIKFTKTEI